MMRRNNAHGSVPRHGEYHPSISQRPQKIGYFSVDGDRNYLSDASRLMYYRPPIDKNMTLDLDVGTDVAVRRTASFKTEGIELLLKWILDNHQKIKPSAGIDKWIEPNFVCTRGLLIRLFIAPYSPADVWKIYAAKFKGTIYLRADKGAEGPLFVIDRDVNKRFASWGHKFEQYVMSDSPDTAPDTSKPVIEPEEFRVVYKHKINKHTVLFTSVIKGICSEKRVEEPLTIDNLEFIDLKTWRIIEHAGHEKTLHRHKFLKWWIMNYLTNTDKILCGFRDDNGIVHKLVTYSTDTMVAMAQGYWKPAECIACCDTFLTKLAESVVNECDETIYEFTKTSRQDFNITELAPTAENAVLPLWYMQATG